MSRRFILHPFLFAIFPVLFLFSHNMGQVTAHQLVMPILFLLVLTGIWLWLLTLVTKDYAKTALIITMFYILFFSYGHVYSFIINFPMGGLKVVRHRFLFTVGILFYLCWIVFVMRHHARSVGVTKRLNVVGVVLLGLLLINILSFTLNTWVHRDDFFTEKSRPLRVYAMPQKNAALAPNIYYIILDAYGRDDVLRSLYHHDNQPFLDALQKRGFSIARKSRSNYCQTLLSLASSLNFDYLTTLAQHVGTNSRDYKPLAKLIAENELFAILRQQGYRLCAFSSGFLFTEIRTVDVFVSGNFSLDNFSNALLNTTPLWVIGKSAHTWDFSFQYTLHRKQLLHVLDTIPKMRDSSAPVFVFAHVLLPHPPFVFGPDGEPVDHEEGFSLIDGDTLGLTLPVDNYQRLYANQTIFLNKQLLTMVDSIQKKDLARPSVIIFQADHGPRSMMINQKYGPDLFRETFPIFNAYYLPGTAPTNDLYEGISPVNTFRVICNRYFSTAFPLLPDKSYFSPPGTPFAFTNVTDIVNALPPIP